MFFCGTFVQDLSRLGRKLERILIVDNSPASYIFHQDNAVSEEKLYDLRHCMVRYQYVFGLR